jgi:hypothetical protein
MHPTHITGLASSMAAFCHLLTSAHAASLPVAPLRAGGDAALCNAAIAGAEAERHVPDGFLAAIGRVESGRPDPSTGAVAPYPWSVNAAGRSFFYASKAEAIQAVRVLQSNGIRLIDVGCLQVDLGMHPEAFASLDQAFDPKTNASYAAAYLVSLFGQTGSWPRAAAAYHSMTPVIGKPYEQHVLAEWAVPQSEMREPPAAPPRRPAAPRLAAVPPPARAHTAAAAAVGAGGFGAPAGRMAALVQPQAGMARPAAVIGRSLAGYRLMPTRLAFRPPNPG